MTHDNRLQFPFMTEFIWKTCCCAIWELWSTTSRSNVNTHLSNYREIESSAALIESLTHATKKGGKGVDPIQKSLINVKAQLQTAEEKITELEESLKEAEEAAR